MSAPTPTPSTPTTPPAITPCRGQHRPGTDEIELDCMRCDRLPPSHPAELVIVPTWRTCYGAAGEVRLCDDVVDRHGDIVRAAPGPMCTKPGARVTRRSRVRVKLGVWLAAAAVALLGGRALGADAPCGPWEPARDPYRGDPAAAVLRLAEIPADERRQLADMVRHGYGWERVMVGRDSIEAGRFAGLRSMNFGAGRVCAGPVDRSTWPAGRHEAARAYVLGRWAVLVLDSCGNVALADHTFAMPEPAAPTRASVRQGYRGGAGGGGLLRVPEPSALLLAAVAVAAALAMTRRAAR